MSKSLQRGILFSICVALVLALSLTLVFFAGGGDKNILSAPQGQVSNAAQNTTSYTHGSYIKRQVPSGVKTVSTGIDFITAVSDNQSVSLASDVALGWNEFGIQAEGISGGWSVDKYTGTIYGNGYTVSLSGLNTTGEVYPASGFNNKAYAGGIVRELGNGGAIYDLNVSVDGHIRVLGASGQYLDLGILVGQMNSDSVIDNCTVTIKSGKHVESMKMSSSIPWARLGLFVGKFADNASNMRITNVTATHNGTIEVGLGTTSGWGGTPGGGNTDESSQGFAGLIFGAASKSATNITLDNIVVAGSGEIWSYAGAPIGMLMGNTAVTINNFFNKTTNGSLFNNISDNRSSNTILDFERNGDNVQGRVVNHYRSSQAQQATADDNNGINVTNTITVSNDNIGKIYFDPTVSDYANSLTIVHDTSNPPVDSANERTYTITGQNGYSATSTEIVDNGGNDRVIFKNLSSTASNWNSDGNFGYNVTYKDTPIFQIPDDDPILFYEHGYVPADYKAAADSTQITSAEQFMSLFRPNGTVDQSGSYYLTEDIAISGFTGNTFNGTLDGCGHTIYIIDKLQDSYTGPNVGGLVGNLGGTIKNLRVVYVNSISDINLTTSQGRVGLVAGKVDGGTLQNVQVVVQEDVEISVGNTGDHEFAMGGVVGEAANNAQITDVTLDHNGRLNPTGQWQFLAGIAGVVKADPASPSLGATFTNVALRGAGKLGGNALNEGQPTFTGAFAVLMPSSGADPTGAFVKADGLIYDFDVTLNGTVQTQGNSNGKYACYYLFTYNYNGRNSDGYVTNKPITEYNKAVEYRNVFIASNYVDEMAAFAGERTNGNAAVGGATINTVKGTVYGAAGSDVAAYFNPVDGENDMIFRATRTTGSWMKDDMVQLVGSDGNLYQSAMEGDHSSPRLVYAPKGVAATNNVVQLTMPSNVFRPEFGKDVLPLTYNGQEQSFVFTLKLNDADQTPLTADDFTVTYRLADASTGSLGSNSLPVNAGEYVATIELQNGYKFIAEGQGTETDTYELTVEISPYTVEINTVFDFDATYGEIGLQDDVISGGKFSAENLFANYDELSSAFGEGIPGIAEITVAAADSSQITASGAGKLPVGSYTVAAIKLDNTNFSATDYVEHLVAFAVTQKSVSAEITINETLPQYYDGNSLTPTVTADHAAAIESGDVSELALKIAVDSAEVDAILNAGTYTFDAELVGADADNYILTPTFKTASGDEIVSGEWTVKPYDLHIQWDFDSQVPLEYGDEISNDLIADTEISEAIPYNGGEFTGFIDFRVTGATYNGGTTYAPGVAVGTSVTFAVEAILPEIEGFIESNYNVILSVSNSGSASTLVEPRTLEINYVNVAENMTPLTYGEELSNALLAERFNESYTYYVSNIYNNEAVSFEVTWYEKIELSGYSPVTDFNGIVPNTAYYGNVQVASGFDNYRLPDNANDTYFEFIVQPKELTVTGVTWEAGFDGVYDGQAHGVVVESDLIEGDVYNFGIDITDENGSPVDSVTDAGTYTVTVSADESNLYYDLSLSGTGEGINEYTITINRYDLANATVTIAESDLVYTGSAITVTPIVKGGENDFTSKLTVVVNGGEAVVNAGEYTVVNAGEYTITASGNTENSGNFEGEASGKFVVAQKQLKLDSLTLSSSTYTGAPITVTGHTFAEGFKPADDEQPEFVIAVQGGAVVNAGEYTFNVSLAADNEVNKNYDMADGAGTITATVSPASVTVTAGKNAELGVRYGESATAETSRFYDEDFITFDPAKPNSTFKLEEALTFTVKNKETQGEVTADQEGVYTLAPGTYTVTYSIKNIDGANYTLEGDTLTTTLIVEEGALKLVIERWDNTSPTYDGTAQLPDPVFANSAEIGEKIEEGALVYEVTANAGSSLTDTDAINAGSYTVTVSIAPDFAEQYELAEGSKNSTDFTIEKREVTLEWKAADDLVYNGKEHTATATATVDNKVVDDDVRVIVGLVSGNDNINVGEFFYEATELTGDDAGNYSLPAEKRQAFEVTPAQVKITWNFVTADAKITYGDSVDAVKALVNTDALDGEIPGVTDPLAFEVSVGDYSATTNAGTEVTFTVSYTLPEGAKANNYEITVSAEGNDKLTVQRANITVTVSVEGKTYDGSAVTPSVTVMFGERELEASEYGAVTYAYAVKGGDTLGAAPADASDSAYTVTASVAESTNFNTATSAAVEFKIARKTVSVAWDDTKLTYNGSAQAPTAKVGEGLVTGDDLQITVSGAQTNASADAYKATAEITGGADMGNYVLAEDATVEFTIARKTVSVKWGDTELTYNGTAQAPTATVGEDQGLITDDDLQITVSGAETDANTDGGSYTATAEITGGADKDNYVLDNTASTSFTIAPKPITITFTSDEGEAIEFDVAGSVTVGAWTADGSDPNKATLILSDGTTDITLTVEASEALPKVENVPALLLLLDRAPYEGTPYGTQVKGGSLTVSSANANYVFEVAQAITLNITPAISVGLKADVETERGLTDVLKTAHNADYFKNNYLKVTGKDGAEVTGGTLEVTITPSEGLELLEGVIKHAGTYTVKAVYTPEGAGDGAEKPTFSFEFTVTPVEVTSVIYSGEPLVYGDLSASGGIAVTVEYADGTKAENVTAQYTSEHVSTGNWLKAGNTQVTVSYTGDNRDYAAVTEEIKLTVEKKTITATINCGEQSGTELTLTYNGSVYTIGAELNDVLSGDGVSAKVLQSSFIDVAAYEVEITLDGSDKDNYTVAGEYTVTITPADVTYEWNFVDGAKITYGDSVEAVTDLAVMPDGALLGVEGKVAFQVSVGDYSATTNAGTEVTFTVSYTLPEGAKEKNYNIIITAADGNTLNVGKATLTLSIADTASLTKVYDGKAVTLGSLLTAGNVSVEGMKNGEDAFTLGILAISGTDEMTNAGTYNGSVSVIDDCNYTAEAIEINYIVTPKPIGVEWTNTEFTYDGTAHKPTATATDLVDGDSLTLTVTGAQTNAGSYTATVEADSVTGNYVLDADATVEFTIAPKPIGVEWTNTAFTYDGTAHKPTATATGLVDGDSLTLTVVTDAQTNAGSYTATVAAFEQGNYKLESTSTRTFTIAKRGLDVAEVAEAVYGDLQVSGTLVTGTHTAFVAYNDEEIELIVNVKEAALSRAAAEYLDAGEYEVTIALVNEEGNFSLNGATLNAETEKMEVQSTLDVAPKTVTVGYTTSSGVYDAKGISITLDKFEHMLIEGDDPAVNIYINDAPYTGKVVLDAGEYTVRYESADPNYAFTPVSATFTVAPKSVTPNFDLNTGSGSQQITGGGKLEIEEGEETDIVAAIDNFMQSSGVSEEDMSISVSGDLKLEDMATWAPGTYTVTVTLSGNHSGSMQFTVEVSEKIELPPPVQPELPETPAEAGSGNDWVLPLVIAIVALIDLALLVAIGVAAKKRA